MDPGSVEKAASALLDAYASGTPITPLTTTFAGTGSVPAPFGREASWAG
ncbi:hypothetical protein [Actinomadura rubrisoli]|nr:hypothetical protein [Actinomadura rubrisoli]